MSPFFDRLFSEDGSEIPDDEIFASAPGKLIMIVILDFFHTDAEQTQRMISSSMNNDVIELESLLKKAFESKCERRKWHDTVALCRRKRTCPKPAVVD